MSKKTDAELLRATALGQELTDQERTILVTKMKKRELQDGELLVSEGEAVTTLFVLIEGRLSVSSRIEGNEVTVYAMSPGECAGTRAFVDRTPRKATLRADGKTTVMTLDPAAFESLLNDHPRIVYNVMRALFRITHSNLMRMNQETQQLTNYIQKTHGRY